MQSSITHRKLSRRSFLTGSLVVMAGSALAACAPAPTATPVPKPTEAPKAQPTEAPKAQATEAPKAQPTTAPKAEPTKAAPKQAITIKFHDRAGAHADWHKKRAALFAEQNPGLTIEFDEIPGDHIAKQYALAASGTIGDVVWCYNSAAGEAMRKGVPLPLNDIVAAEKFDTGVFWPTMIASFTYEGKLIGIPNHGHYGTTIFYHNEDMFKAAGVPLPTPDWTIEDMVAAAKKMTKAPDQWGLRTNPLGGEFVPFYFRTFGGGNINAEGTKALFNTDGSKAAIKWLMDLKNTFKVDPCLCGDQTRDNFVAGKVGIYNWTPGYAAEFVNIKEWKFKWNAVVAPAGPGGARGSNVSGAAFCVTKASKNPKEAFQVLKFYSTKEDGIEHVWGGAGSPGPRPDVWESQRLNDYHPIYKQLVAKYPKGPESYNTCKNLRFSEFITTQDANLQAIYTGKVEMNAGIEALQKACQEILDREML